MCLASGGLKREKGKLTRRSSQRGGGLYGGLCVCVCGEREVRMSVMADGRN